MSIRSLLSLIVFTVSPTLIGCGGHQGGLATDSGEMTVEEYDQMLAEQEGNIAPPEGLDGPE